MQLIPRAHNIVANLCGTTSWSHDFSCKSLWFRDVQQFRPASLNTKYLAMAKPWMQAHHLFLRLNITKTATIRKKEAIERTPWGKINIQELFWSYKKQISTFARETTNTVKRATKLLQEGKQEHLRCVVNSVFQQLQQPKTQNLVVYACKFTVRR